MSVEILIDQKHANSNSYPDEIDGESELADILAAEQAADQISILNRIYNSPHSGRP